VTRSPRVRATCPSDREKIGTAKSRWCRDLRESGARQSPLISTDGTWVPRRLSDKALCRNSSDTAELFEKMEEVRRKQPSFMKIRPWQFFEAEAEAKYTAPFRPGAKCHCILFSSGGRGWRFSAAFITCCPRGPKARSSGVIRGDGREEVGTDRKGQKEVTNFKSHGAAGVAHRDGGSVPRKAAPRSWRNWGFPDSPIWTMGRSVHFTLTRGKRYNVLVILHEPQIVEDRQYLEPIEAGRLACRLTEASLWIRSECERAGVSSPRLHVLSRGDMQHREERLKDHRAGLCSLTPEAWNYATVCPCASDLIPRQFLIVST